MPIVGTSTTLPAIPIAPSGGGGIQINQFPVILSTGAIARYPMARLRTYSTRVMKFADFSEQRFSQLAAPLMTWDITMSQLLDSEFEDCQAFYDAQLGSAGTFTFIDPFDNLLQYSEEFENAAWIAQGGMFVGRNYLLNSQDFELSPWSGSNNGCSNPIVTADNQTAPDGTTTADTIAFPLIPNTIGDFSQLLQVVTPPAVPSQKFTFSVWLKAASSFPLNLILQDNPAAEFHSAAVTVTTVWQRLSVTGAFTSGANASLAIGLQSGQNSPAVSVFAWGAQIEYGAAPSDYTPTTSATAVLQIADPYFIPAPAVVPGSNWNLNSQYPRSARQIVITATSNPAIIQNISVKPCGTGSSGKGITLTGSFHILQQGSSTPPTFPVAVHDSNFFEANTLTITPTLQWTRYQAAKTFSASNNSPTVGLQFGGNGTSATGTFYLFAAQLECESAASAYKKTRAISGVHTKCHFMGDEMAHLLSEFNQNVFENSQRTRVGGSRLADVITIYESA